MDERTATFIERMGLLAEEDGLPRIAGRIFAYLLVTPGECSLDEIANALGVSRASVSTDTRRLAQLGLVERRSRPADRRDFYALGEASTRSWFEHRLREMRRFGDVLGEARALPKLDDTVRTRIDRWGTANSELMAAFEELLGRLPA